jgi:hypothetical protein
VDTPAARARAEREQREKQREQERAAREREREREKRVRDLMQDEVLNLEQPPAMDQIVSDPDPLVDLLF